jgi:hypothetical protein
MREVQRRSAQAAVVQRQAKRPLVALKAVRWRALRLAAVAAHSSQVSVVEQPASTAVTWPELPAACQAPECCCPPTVAAAP